MADHLRPMEELQRIPILGIENAIVVPAVLADQFENRPVLLISLVTDSFLVLKMKIPYHTIRRLNPNTQTLRLNPVPVDIMKIKILESIFPHSKTKELRKEITNFQQVFGETFTEAWERFKDLLRKCPHHEFSLLYQIDFFYNGLCQSDQDSPNTAAGGNLMKRNNQDAFTTIENKARVQTCRNTPQVSSNGGTSTQIDAITILTKQVEALQYHFASMRENYDHNQETSNLLMQNQMGQMEEIFQERQSCVLPSNTDPRAELHVITSMDGLTLDGSFIPHSLVYQEKEQEPETITEGNNPRITFLEMEDEEIKFNPFKDIDDSVAIQRVSVTPLDSLDSFFDSYDTSYTNPSELYSEYPLNYDNQLFNIQNEHSDEPKTETIMDEVHITVQIPPLFEELTSDKSMQDIILHRIHHGMINSSRLSFYLDLFSPKDNFGSLSSDTFELGDQNIVFDPGIFFINGVFSFARKSPHLMINNFMFDKCHILREISLMIESSVSFYPKDKEIRGESS
ncbi:reverse transcriptase domain-containing protein [Tanacetum coccineum]